MCGILAALGVTGDAETNRRDILKLSKLLRHRGPDQNTIYQSPDAKAFITFERLMIVDPTESGRQMQRTAPCARAPPPDPSRSPYPTPPRCCRQPFQIKTPEGNITWAL